MEASGGAYFLQSLAATYEKCAARTRPRVGAPKLFLLAVGGVRPGLGGKERPQGPVADEGKDIVHAARVHTHGMCVLRSRNQQAYTSLHS